MGEVYKKALNFKRNHPGGVVWRLKKHCEVVEKHLNPGEEVIFAFGGQKNDTFYDLFTTCVVVLTNKRITIIDRRGVRGFRRTIYSIPFSSISTYSIDIHNFDTAVEIITSSGYQLIVKFQKPIPLETMYSIYNYISNKVK